jgi:hypothetical protein
MMKTRSELAFERFLAAHGIPYRPILIAPEKTPDYGVTVTGAEIIFEVKEIVSDHAWDDDIVHGGTVGEQIRKRINSSKGQIQAASREGKPTVLLIFNNYDPLQLSGTEDHDFEHAMYGAYTLRIDSESRRIVDRYHGDGKSLQAAKNTSFSALGRLKEGRGTEVSVTLFENIHARVPIDYDSLPSCFEVVRVEWPASTEPCEAPASPP